MLEEKRERERERGSYFPRKSEWMDGGPSALLLLLPPYLYICDRESRQANKVERNASLLIIKSPPPKKSREEMVNFNV